MAKIAPFRGTRYVPEKVGNLSSVVTLPYDRITPELQDKYYAANEYNICRVIKGKEDAADTETNNVYTRAAEYWRQWIAAGAVAEDTTPALYAYYQVFKINNREYTRRGMCVMVELQDYSSGGIKPHERTLDAPKQDRFKLLTQTNTHFGQVFQLYPDEANQVAELLAPHCKGAPDLDVEVQEEPGVRHRFWAITDPETIAAVEMAMADKLLFIADGHHRYETALNYRNHILQSYKGGSAGHHPRFAMMTLVGMSDPGLIVLPTHRVLHSLPDFNIGRLVAQLYEHFRVEAGLSRQEMLDKLAEARQDASRHAFGLYGGGKYTFFELTDTGIMEELAPDRTPDWRNLDVAILHEVILEKILGIDKAAQAAKTNLSYDRDAQVSIDRVDRGTHQCAFFMNPTRMDQIRDVAGKGEVMPQKSTDFYPKLITGGVACQVDLGEKL
ncbi:DUF1015 domain-containing protein [bacterium]|nr:DUF1015 domain-containing protein [bacterium]